MKYSIIKPLFKKGDKKDRKNYRPISLLTSFSKIFEKVIHARLTEHVINNNILSMEQYGFRSNSSTQKATFKLLNDILQAFNNKSFVGGIFCDLEKAFDCVNHDILMKKLEFYGIVGRANTLVKSYLKDRYRVLVEDNLTQANTTSDWGKIKHGVPQGSVLGPLFFLFYINDLPKVVNTTSQPILFPDDTSIIVSNPNSVNFKKDLISSFEQLNMWFNTNLLLLNFNKTQYLQFKTTNSLTISIHISCNNKYIVNNTETQFLGITIDSSLSWKNHIDGLTVKLSKASYAIRTLRPFVTLESLRIFTLLTFIAL